MVTTVNALHVAAVGKQPDAARFGAREALIALFVTACLLLVLARTGTILRIGFVIGSVAIALYLFRTGVASYVAFVLWLWFLTPFLRRVADFQAGWVDPNPILLAPVLASLAPVGLVVWKWPSWRGSGSVPFLLAGVASIYGLVIGCARLPIAAVMTYSLAWFAPIAFGLAIYGAWRHYPEVSRSTQRAFRWGLMIAGAYAIVQFTVLPGWDELWMTQSGLLTLGNPVPFQVRVFSTMNAPGPFAATMMAGALLLTADSALMLIPAGVGGYVALLLSQSRASWFSWAVGIAVILCVVSLRRAGRLFGILLVLTLLLIPLVAVEPVSSMMRTRFESLLNLDHDVSRLDRMKGYKKMSGVIASEPFGKGIGVMDIEYGGEGNDDGGPHDSALLELLVSLGWAGGGAYLAALGLLLRTLLKNLRTTAIRKDPFAVACHVITIALLAQLPLGSVMLGPTGALLWGFGALSLASSRYHLLNRRIPDVALAA